MADCPGRIIVGVNATAHAAAAAGWAADEAADRHMPLHLVNALDLPSGGHRAHLHERYDEPAHAASALLLRHIAAMVADQYPKLPVTTETTDIGAAESLVALGGAGDLVVTGTRGHGGFAGLVLGSVSLKTAVHARCPAIVVRSHDASPSRPEIVLGLEPGQDEAPIRFAFDSCERLGTRLLVVRAWLSAPSYAGHYLTNAPATESEQLADIDELIEPIRAKYPTVEVETSAIRGNTVPSLIEAARGARLLVVGAHRRRGPVSVGVGYVMQGLLSYAQTPVGIVPIF